MCSFTCIVCLPSKPNTFQCGIFCKSLRQKMKVNKKRKERNSVSVCVCVYSLYGLSNFKRTEQHTRKRWHWRIHISRRSIEIAVSLPHICVLNLFKHDKALYFVKGVPWNRALTVCCAYVRKHCVISLVYQLGLHYMLFCSIMNKPKEKERTNERKKNRHDKSIHLND